MFPEIEIEALEEGVSLENPEKVKASLKMLQDNLIYYSEFAKAYMMQRMACIFYPGKERETLKALDNGNVVSDERIRAYIAETYAYYIAGLNESEPQIRTRKTGQTKNIKNICRYIDENYMDHNFSVKRVAEEFHMSPSNLSHFFKKATGQTLSQYVEYVRIREGVQLLSEMNIKISDIAVRLGYISTTSFIEAFKKHYGMTPKAYQKQMLRSERESLEQSK